MWIRYNRDRYKTKFDNTSINIKSSVINFNVVMHQYELDKLSLFSYKNHFIALTLGFEIISHDEKWEEKIERVKSDGPG